VAPAARRRPRLKTPPSPAGTRDHNIVAWPGELR
jgi:hypothetical protein